MNSLLSRLDINKRFEFSCSAFRGEDKFSVVNMEGYESVSRPFRFTLTLVTDDPAIDFDTVLQATCTFRIFAPDTSLVAPYHGVLAEFEQMHQANGYYFYRAVLVPRLWRLSLYRVSEVYLNEQTIPQIMAAIFKDSRLGNADYELRLTGSYRPRSFVCQYQESHLDFISRWMEKEGIAYFFDHEGTADRLIMVDDKAMYPARMRKVDYRPVDTLDTGLTGDSVQNFICRQKPLPNKVLLQDFNHRKAGVELKADAVVSDKGIGEVMIYGENFRDEQEGKRYAKLRAEEILCGGKVFTGEATAIGLRSGYFIELAHHYRSDFNGKYLVTEITHEGSQAGALLSGIAHPYGGTEGETVYRNNFSAIPAAVQFRPQRLTPKPRVAGMMNATVDAEGSGEYAELDEYGQYKVQLPFDRSGKAAGKGSARVRMATPYAGSDHGMHFPLLKNAEVLLSFTDGDPDQPVIVGAVPNSENPSVINNRNAAVNMINTKGGNQLHMGDEKGKEVIWLNSPFHNSSIGIGSVDPRGGGSILEATKGALESICKGTKSTWTYGSANSITVGGKNDFSVSWGSKISVGPSMSVNILSAPTTLNLSGFSRITVDDTGNTQLSNSSSQVTMDSYQISAGRSALPGNTFSIDVENNKKLFKRVNTAFSTLKLAETAVLAAGSEKAENWATFMKNYGGIMGAAETAASFLIHYGYINKKMKLLHQDAPNKLVSHCKLDNKGIILKADFAAGSTAKALRETSLTRDGVNLGAEGEEGYSMALLAADGLSLGSFLNKTDKDIDTANCSRIKLNYGSTTITAKEHLWLKVDGLASDLKLGDNVAWLRCGTTKRGVTMDNEAVKLFYAPNGAEVLLNDKEASLKFGTAASFTANTNGLKLSVGGASADFTAQSVNMVASLIRLG